MVLARQMLLVRASNARWREMFERADIMSEGRVREEAQGRVWYGSTSLILPAPVADIAFFAAVAERDVHVRIRARPCRASRGRLPGARPAGAAVLRSAHHGRSPRGED